MKLPTPKEVSAKGQKRLIELLWSFKAKKKKIRNSIRVGMVEIEENFVVEEVFEPEENSVIEEVFEHHGEVFEEGNKTTDDGDVVGKDKEASDDEILNDEISDEEMEASDKQENAPNLGENILQFAFDDEHYVWVKDLATAKKVFNAVADIEYLVVIMSSPKCNMVLSKMRVVNVSLNPTMKYYSPLYGVEVDGDVGLNKLIFEGSRDDVMHLENVNDGDEVIEENEELKAVNVGLNLAIKCRNPSYGVEADGGEVLNKLLFEGIRDDVMHLENVNNGDKVIVKNEELSVSTSKLLATFNLVMKMSIKMTIFV
ncbi:hypothetical protein ACH5RR_033035 [Cinchona calisaya]|uniref:Uncharacterized protein n=1 Tax=Cinchona calisaya TaxID=153742 RepID=A0ABD2YKZ9_9GENT